MDSIPLTLHLRLVFTVMEVTLLRGRDGKVIFMECKSQFVDALVAITRAPLGGIVGAIAVEEPQLPGQTLPGKDLCESVANLREELFDSSKADVLAKPTDLESVIRGKHAKPMSCKFDVLRSHQVEHTKVSRGNSTGIQLTARSPAWTTNAVFDIGDRHDFEISLVAQGSLPNIMLGIAPGSVNVSKHNLFQSNGFYLHVITRALYSQDGTSAKSTGWEEDTTGTVKMRLTGGNTNPVLEYAFGDKAYAVAEFSTAIPSNPNYCPIVLFSAQNSIVTVEDIGPRLDGDRLKGVVNAAVKFLVSNRLQVLENSCTTAIAFISQHNGESLAGLRSETVQVTASAWRRLIAGSLLGRDDILDFAFPLAAASAAANGDVDGVSTAGDSETSFQLTSAVEQAARGCGGPFPSRRSG